jgi:L-lysine 6-transaminase
VFHKGSRINSTWGGNLADMVRSEAYLEVIEEEGLVERAAESGLYLQGWLNDIARQYPDLVSNPRGRGLFCAIDFNTKEKRDEVRNSAMKHGLLILPCGEKTLRFRPALNIERKTLDEGLAILADQIKTASSVV